MYICVYIIWMDLSVWVYAFHVDIYICFINIVDSRPLIDIIFVLPFCHQLLSTQRVLYSWLLLHLFTAK